MLNVNGIQDTSRGLNNPESLRSDWRRQYVFVAATMPAEGKKSTAADLRAAFPDAVWLAGPQLHRPQRQIAHSWLYLDDPSQWESTLLVCPYCPGHPPPHLPLQHHARRSIILSPAVQSEPYLLVYELLTF